MNQRLERVNQLLRDEICDILLRDLHDPLIGFVTITEVDTSSDLRFATVYFSVLGDAAQVKESIKGLLRARKYINARVAERVELRYIPKLRFQLDDTAARAQQMETMLANQHGEFGEAPPPEKEAEPVAEAEELDDEDFSDDELDLDDENKEGLDEYGDDEDLDEWDDDDDEEAE